jgi:hypothetical protein
MRPWLPKTHQQACLLNTASWQAVSGDVRHDAIHHRSGLAVIARWQLCLRGCALLLVWYLTQWLMQGSCKLHSRSSSVLTGAPLRAA